MKIYLASSWKNSRQPSLLATLRAAGHDVYDFRNPAPDNNGFGWREITPAPRPWPLSVCRSVLDHPIAEGGFEHDRRALAECEAVVLLLPCGASAHLEAGYAVGQGKPVVVYGEVDVEPELMWKLFGAPFAHIATHEVELLAILGEWSVG